MKNLHFLALTGLACLLNPLFSQNVGRTGDRRGMSLRIASSSETRPPAFPLGPSLSLENNRVSWVNDALLTFEKSGTANPIVHSFDKDGSDTPAVVSIPGAATINVEDVTHSGDGTLAVCGYALDSEGHRSGFIYQISPDRQSAKVIRMSGFYLPNLVSIAADGSFWVKGWEAMEIIGRNIKQDAPVIRRFDKDGKFQAGYLSQRRVLSSLPRPILTSSPGFLVSSSNRVGWHQSFPPARYYEFLPDGTSTEYPGVPMVKEEFLVGFAMTERGEVFAGSSVWGGQQEKSHGYHLYALDREAREWREVEFPNGPAFKDLKHLTGVQGNALVFNTSKPGVSRILSLDSLN